VRTNYLEKANKLSNLLLDTFGPVGVLTPVDEVADGTWVDANFWLPEGINTHGQQKIRNEMHTRVRTERVGLVERVSPGTAAWNVVPAFMVRGPAPMLYLMTREWPLIIWHETYLTKHIQSREATLAAIRADREELRTPAILRAAEQEQEAFESIRLLEPDGELLLGDLILLATG
jgi:hypothetical protein